MNTKPNNTQQIKQLNPTLDKQQDLPTNMNARFCTDMINELQIARLGQVSDHHANEDLVYITSRGHLYRKKKFTFDGVATRYEWTILHNNNGACGWYRVDSPELKTSGGGIIMSDGSRSFFDQGDVDTQVFHIKNLRYCLVSPMSQEKVSSITNADYVDNVGKEEIYIYISLQEHQGDLLLGYMYPLFRDYAENGDRWITAPNIKDNIVFDGWKNSYKLEELTFYEPHFEQKFPVFFKTSVNPQEPSDHPPETELFDYPFDWGPLEGPNTSWDTEYFTPWENECTDHIQEKHLSTTQCDEYRWDPSNGGAWYSKADFVEYYGDEFMWNIVAPEKNCKRYLIEDMIERGQNVLSSDAINHLLDKIIETFM